MIKLYWTEGFQNIGKHKKEISTVLNVVRGLEKVYWLTENSETTASGPWMHLTFDYVQLFHIESQSKTVAHNQN